jgi:Ser/Thr protein kinase RdoA (MazF antagonist)
VPPSSYSSDSPDAVLGHYSRLRAPRVTPIARGLIHQTWRIDDGDASYVLQRLNSMFSLAVHDNIEAVTARLEERGVETPRLCRTDVGELFADLGEEGGRFRLMTWVEGSSHDTCPSLQHAASAGRLVARFHSALGDLEHEFAPLGFSFHDTALYFAELDRALAAHTDHPLHGEVVAIAREIREAASRWESLEGVPDRVVHLDLKFNNLLFRSLEPGGEATEACCLIDLDTLSRMPLWVEMGDAWRSWCNRRPEYEPEAELDPAVFEASAGAWLGAVELDLRRPEIESLAHGIERLTLELCSRFAADALAERYFGWNAERFSSAGEHNLNRARGQLSMHAQARATRADRIRFLLG